MAYDGPLQIGSLRLRLRAARDEDVEALALMFKQSLDGSADPARPLSGQLAILDELPQGSIANAGVPPDGLLVDRRDARTTLRSEVMTTTIEGGPGAWRIAIAVHRRSDPPLVYRLHLSLMLHRTLLTLGCVHLHAAGVTVRGATWVFIGEKGAGKSSISTALGRDGAIVLADDHVLLRAADPHYLVSGCETRARVAADTEAVVFGRPLAGEPADFAGTMKKEFALAEFFRSRPHTDVPVAALCFPSVGARLTLTPRSARETILDLLARTRRSFRPQDAGDVRLLLDFWTRLAGSTPAFALELSPDLGELARLPDVLDRCLRC